MKTTIATLAVAALALPAVARGNCYYPDYDVHSTEDDYHICLTSADRSCPDEGLLRVNVETGEVVRITSCDEHGCFLDECVPEGNFQYGLAIPYTCTGDRCGTVWYWPTGQAELSPECTRSVPAPERVDGAPWDPRGDAFLCSPTADVPRTLGCQSAGAVLGLNGALLALGALLWRCRRR